MISEEYKDKIYNRTLFELDLKEIKQNNLDINYIEALILKCEHNERIRSIIENYLSYIVELNFEPISNNYLIQSLLFLN